MIIYINSILQNWVPPCNRTYLQTEQITTSRWGFLAIVNKSAIFDSKFMTSVERLVELIGCGGRERIQGKDEAAAAVLSLSSLKFSSSSSSRPNGWRNVCIASYNCLWGHIMYLDILQFNLYPFIIFMSGLLTLNFKEVRKCAKLSSIHRPTCASFRIPKRFFYDPS